MKTTWDDIARRYSVRRCLSCAGDHKRGYVSRSSWTIHWTDRRVTRAGLRMFLMLVAQCIHSDWESLPEWRRLYVSNTWAFNQSLKAGVRLPATLSDTDRARVRWLISKEENVPDEVRRWANRRVTT
jgi:hypothetical protein